MRHEVDAGAAVECGGFDDGGFDDGGLDMRSLATAPAPAA
jgi:hypothetical protein